MRMLQEGQDAEVSVTWEDQSNINTFAKLNNRLALLEDDYAAKKREKEYFDDLVADLELAELDDDDDIDDDDVDTDGHGGEGAALDRATKDQEQLQHAIEELKSQMDGVVSQMEKLKVLLYGKFGNSINLDK